MKIDPRFPTRAKTLAEVPEPFRRPLRKRITSEESVSLLAYAPAHKSLEHFPATLLAITDQQWLILEKIADSNVVVNDATFDETLLLEMTEILLFGRLKIEYAADGATKSGSVHFNSAMDKLYHEAVHLLLNGISGQSSVYDPDAMSPLSSPDWPLKFGNDMSKVLPSGARMVASAYWPAVKAGFRRELAPAAALVLTDNEIILAADPPAGDLSVPCEDNKYGRVVTYLPLVRLAEHRITEHEQFSILELDTHASHGSERLQVILPSSHTSGVADLMNCVFAGTR